MQGIDMLKSLGIGPADILLPENGVDMQRWAVIACDQYSSDLGYWAKADAFVGESPSTLRLMVPEAYRDSPEHESMKQKAPAVMEKFLTQGVFRTVPQSFVYVERMTPFGSPRRGLVAAFDLEKYEFKPGNSMPIRATEETILSRMPPRMLIRSAAPLECPHIMVLVDDPGHTVIEPLAAKKDTLEKLYDTALMLGAGSIAGWRVHGEAEFTRIAQALKALAARGGMLFAVGDGNHSLAAAKACWDELKGTLPAEQRETHPARWALAELVNLHDEALSFHPIHRVVFGADARELLAVLLWEMNKRGWEAVMGDEPEGSQSIKYVCAEDKGWLNIARPPVPMAVGTLQQALDIVLPGIPGASVDYVHGDDAAACLGMKPGNMAFLLRGMEKSGLFPTVESQGILPRKAFSMGEADEKRFYLECRKIK